MWRYAALPGFFIQADPESNEDCPVSLVRFFVEIIPVLKSLMIRSQIPPSFGLKDDSTDRWTTFKKEIERLNASAPSGTQYKVVFVGRHGEGYHNVAMEKYTLEARQGLVDDSDWTKCNGDGEFVWGPDPELTERGVGQARDAHQAWKTELEYGIPLPGKLYSSPMRRAIRTNQVTFDGLVGPNLKTTIVENVRERNGVSTCDKRRKMSEIASDFPNYMFENGFTEEDETWDPEIRETFEEIDVRARKTLNTIFDNDEEHFISITSHNRFIDSFLRVCGHRPWILPTGGVIPVVLRAEQLSLN